MAKETVICTYRVHADRESEFKDLLQGHWAIYHELGFVTDDHPITLRAMEEPTYVEVFTWLEGGFEQAHQHPDVLAMWERMEPLLEERDGKPKWEFPHYTRL